jgi:hypothetical protein
LLGPPPLAVGAPPRDFTASRPPGATAGHATSQAVLVWAKCQSDIVHCFSNLQKSFLI